MLRRHADRLGFRSDFTIYDTSDSKSLVKSIIKELKLDDKAYRPGHVLSDISWAKNALYSPATMPPTVNSCVQQQMREGPGLPKYTGYIPNAAG